MNIVNDFFIWGMCDDYLGRRCEPPVVDHFYPAEIKAGHLMCSAAKKLDVEKNFNDETLVKVEKSGHFVIVNNSATTYLNEKFYNGDQTWGSTLTQRAISEVAKNEVEYLSYLYGAFVRNGQQLDDCISIRLANSGRKADNIKTAISNLGIMEIVHKTTFAIPCSNIIQIKYAQPHKCTDVKTLFDNFAE
jgi:hypothetical protein